MPTRPLVPAVDTFNSIKTWLNNNLEESKKIKACCKFADAIPTSKGIYFWFMDAKAYGKLKNTNPLKSTYQKKINGRIYHLVYTGTAGVRNNRSGENNGDLNQRIQWHLCDQKSISSLCNGTMSTFRRTIGSLLADDLIDNNTQDIIDDFFCKYFYIFYLEYPGTFLQVKDLVNSDESVLINVLRPIFNLDKNPNAKIVNHITYKIQETRQSVETITKSKWCNAEKSIAKATNKNKKAPPKLVTASSVEWIKSTKNCVEFTVNRSQNISAIAQTIKGLPVGPCSIELFSENRNDKRIYINAKSRSIRAKNRTVSDYFNAVDTANGDIQKWKIVYNEMNNKKKIIDSITVRVCKVK